MENGRQPWRPLGQMLVERGLINSEQLENALREHARTGEPIGTVLVALEYIPEQTLRNVLLEQCGLDLTRQEGFGSGLLGELERRRGVVHRSVVRETAPPTAQPSATPTTEPAPAPEDVGVAVALEAPPSAPESVTLGVEEEPARNGYHHEARDAVRTSIDALLETFEERSRALSAELAAMRQLLHEIAG